MVELVLEKTGLKLVCLNRNLVAIEIPSHYMHPSWPDYLPGQSWHRQASFFERPFAVGLDDLGVDNGAKPVAHIPNEQPFLYSHLRGGQSDAVGFVHRLDHPIYDVNQRAVDVDHFIGPLPQHRIADNAYVVGDHETEGYLRGMASRQHTPIHYFGAEPDVASWPKPAVVNVGDIQLRLVTDRGVFSYGKLDAGTRLLLLEAPALNRTDRRVLDLGCGWGPIACVVARRAPHTQVIATDVNRRALRLAAQNATACGALNVTVAHPDDVDTSLRFHRILCNPPIRIGKIALRKMLTVWLDRLETVGRAHLVVHHHLGSDSLAQWLAGQGYGVTRLLSRMGYRILEVKPRPGRVESDDTPTNL